MNTNILSPGIVKLLRGEFNAPGEWVVLTGLGRDYYRAGKAGQTFEPVTDPGGLLEATERVNKFLLCCWAQGQEAPS